MMLNQDQERSNTELMSTSVNNLEGGNLFSPISRPGSANVGFQDLNNSFDQDLLNREGPLLSAQSQLIDSQDKN